MKRENINWVRSRFSFDAKIHVPVLGKMMNVRVDPEAESSTAPSISQIRALTSFLSLTAESRETWTHQLALDCYYSRLELVVDDIEPPMRLKRRKDVWRFCKLSTIHIPEHGKSRDRYVFLSGSCDWEEEHGLELLFKNETLLKVGRQEGLSSNEEWTDVFIDE